jgi:hypothetical protein
VKLSRSERAGTSSGISEQYHILEPNVKIPITEWKKKINIRRKTKAAKIKLKLIALSHSVRFFYFISYNGLACILIFIPLI